MMGINRVEHFYGGPTLRISCDIHPIDIFSSLNCPLISIGRDKFINYLVLFALVLLYMLN